MHILSQACPDDSVQSSLGLFRETACAAKHALFIASSRPRELGTVASSTAWRKSYPDTLKELMSALYRPITG
jgi:hypothetical protein